MRSALLTFAPVALYGTVVPYFRLLSPYSVLIYVLHSVFYRESRIAHAILYTPTRRMIPSDMQSYENETHLVA